MESSISLGSTSHQQRGRDWFVRETKTPEFHDLHYVNKSVLNLFDMKMMLHRKCKCCLFLYISDVQWNSFSQNSKQPMTHGELYPVLRGCIRFVNRNIQTESSRLIKCNSFSHVGLYLQQCAPSLHFLHENTTLFTTQRAGPALRRSADSATQTWQPSTTWPTSTSSTTWPT